MGDLDFRRLNGGPNEPWSFGPRAGPILEAHIHLRERLRPYLRRLAADAARSGAPPMRPLFWDFPENPDAWTIDDEFMLGPDALVAPVLRHGLRARAVCLPEQASWVCAWTGATADGTRPWPAPLARIPVFVRRDSALHAARRDIFDPAAKPG
jgi:alpha-D-xyloside xylohydrolase